MPSANSTRTDLPAPRKFVVLLHRQRDSEHYDLMIENGERLATWKFPLAPEESTRADIQGRRIGEHRRHYLDYEGPISDDRGFVNRHDQGICRVLLQNEDCWKVTFEGTVLRGDFELLKTGQSEDAWLLRRSRT